jgi:hypothetical protein
LVAFVAIGLKQTRSVEGSAGPVDGIVFTQSYP